MNDNKIRKIYQKNIEFIYEQDGISEREFKSKLINVFQSDENIKKAYLAMVKYDNSETSVALCVSVLPNQSEFFLKVHSIFHSMFSPGQFLDIIILNNFQENQIKRVCCPFYERSQ